jgi:hypothetical protein
MESPNDAPVTSADLKLLRDQVDILQVGAAEKKQPWYKQRPSLASLLALGVSVITFLVSQQGATRQEIRGKQDALRKILTDMLALESEGQEHLAAIADQSKRAQLSSQLNSRILIWIDDAEALVDQLGSHVSASEYQTLGAQKFMYSNAEMAGKYFDKALSAARDRDGRSAALRSLGEFYFERTSKHSPERARKYYQEAIVALGDPTDDSTKFMLGYIYESWSYREQFNGFSEERAEKIKMARQTYNEISPFNPLRQFALSTLAANNPDLSP